jgi:hypothetical protein
MRKPDNKDPILVPQKPRPVHTCPQCGHSLIRGFGISVCENWQCDSLPKNIAPAASLEAWMGL